MRKTSALDERIWEAGWEGHERAQLRRMALLTLDQKLEWLEAAHRMVLEMEKERAARGERTIR